MKFGKPKDRPKPRSTQQPAAQAAAPTQFQGGCWKCGEAGHRSSSCPNRTATRPNGGNVARSFVAQSSHHDPMDPQVFDALRNFSTFKCGKVKTICFARSSWTMVHSIPSLEMAKILYCRIMIS